MISSFFIIASCFVAEAFLVAGTTNQQYHRGRIGNNNEQNPSHHRSRLLSFDSKRSYYYYFCNHTGWDPDAGKITGVGYPPPPDRDVIGEYTVWHCACTVDDIYKPIVRSHCDVMEPCVTVSDGAVLSDDAAVAVWEEGMPWLCPTYTIETVLSAEDLELRSVRTCVQWNGTRSVGEEDYRNGCVEYDIQESDGMSVDKCDVSFDETEGQEADATRYTPCNVCSACSDPDLGGPDDQIQLSVDCSTVFDQQGRDMADVCLGYGIDYADFLLQYQINQLASSGSDADAEGGDPGPNDDNGGNSNNGDNGDNDDEGTENNTNNSTDSGYDTGSDNGTPGTDDDGTGTEQGEGSGNGDNESESKRSFYYEYCSGAKVSPDTGEITSIEPPPPPDLDVIGLLTNWTCSCRVEDTSVPYVTTSCSVAEPCVTAPAAFQDGSSEDGDVVLCPTYDIETVIDAADSQLKTVRTCAELDDTASEYRSGCIEYAIDETTGSTVSDCTASFVDGEGHDLVNCNSCTACAANDDDIKLSLDCSNIFHYSGEDDDANPYDDNGACVSYGSDYMDVVIAYQAMAIEAGGGDGGSEDEKGDDDEDVEQKDAASRSSNPATKQPSTTGTRRLLILVATFVVVLPW